MSDAATKDEPSTGRRRRALLVLLPFCAGYYVSYLLRTVNAVIAPELVRELGLGAADLGFLTSTYFLAFAAAQLPVGAALDRLGPSRVVSALLLVAAAGVALFAGGHSFATLAIGRGLVGLGVSACLMGAFKAFGQAFPAHRQTALTGVVMACGAIGALTASLPLEAALPVFGWRNSLRAVGVVSVAVAALIALAGRQQLSSPATPATSDARALASVLTSRAFWRFGPQAALVTGGFMALQSLWVVPWLMTVEGRSRAGAAAILMLLNAGLLTGQLTVVAAGSTLAHGRLQRERFMVVGLGLALLVFGLIVAGVTGGAVAWFLFGFFNAGSAQVYGVTAGYFPSALAGRVTTAVNLLAFVGAFALQWGIGVAVQALGHAGVTPAGALRLPFAVLGLAQMASVVWSARVAPPPAAGQDTAAAASRNVTTS